MPKYRRILLKLSGEALAGDSDSGFEARRASEIAAQVAALVKRRVETGVVVGGGNFFRGARDGSTGIRRTTLDAMGMLATCLNALALADLLSAQGVEAETMSAVAMEPLITRFSRSKALEALQAGRAVVFSAGTGNPYFSTDTAAALRAAEIGADIVLKATNVDGIYDKDPRRHSDARRFETVSYAQVLEQGLGVMDAAAAALCRENKIPVLVFDLGEPEALAKAVEGESVGTLMS